jgi:hypothetical protein
MRVVSYLNVVPAKNKSQEKIDILKKFIIGVGAAGDTGVLHQGYDLQKCDVGIIQGWQHETGKNAPHLRLRQGVIQRTHNTHVCTADSNLFLYANKTNQPHHYLRYSFNGVFPNTGNYFDTQVNPKRWKKISKHLGIKIGADKKDGSDIILCLQREGGWSMGKMSIFTWIENTILELRRHTSRRIVIRSHPGDKKAQTHYIPQLVQKYKNDATVKISSFGTPLEHDLKNAWAVVNHNSSSIVGPLIMGYPAFITDPIKSQCSEVCHQDFRHIESPQVFDRQLWLERISMFHWNFEELENGDAWRHIRQFA